MIPFVRQFAFDYGACEQVSPLIRRVVARNPGPFTFTGTGAHIVGHGTVAVIDPGPDLPSQLDAILAATRGERISHIFVTHNHLDHSPLARPLAQASGATIFAGGGPGRASHGADRLEAGDDLGFRPDVALVDGARFEGPGWTIKAMATPGHTANHFAYVLAQEHALFPGDCVMGWSTSVVSPPDGDMADYLASLEKVRRRRFHTLWPAHGPPIRDVDAFLGAYIDHRHDRERQILAALDAVGPATVRRLVAMLYADVDRRLHPAAAHSVLAHLIKLVGEGRAACSGLPTIGAVYRPARLRQAA
ncbi:MBL fold metallo-hydrolase [Caulobacter sp. KR2-114]|uniref:MBL fold metallo-hydrolase n=1 Tax=Caulobacter sp. KR2-114 TaxID=3400912 RepID=UPI003BFE170E